jgi:hypothetical protein
MVMVGVNRYHADSRPLEEKKGLKLYTFAF